MKKVAVDKWKKPITDGGQRIYDLTEYFEKGGGQDQKYPETPSQGNFGASRGMSMGGSMSHEEKTIPCPECGEPFNGRYPRCYKCTMKKKAGNQEQINVEDIPF